MNLQTKTTLMLPIPLDEKRKVEIGERMAEVELLINSKEDTKKAIAAEYSEEIKNLESELYGLAKQFKDNAVNAEIECRVDYNTPERGQKTITRLDTNNVVKVYDMVEKLNGVTGAEHIKKAKAMNETARTLVSMMKVEIDIAKTIKRNK